MTRRRSSPLGLELVVSVVLALVTLPLLSHGAPLQDSHADLQKYSEGCYYNYNHYSEGDRILTNEPCLNCTCHNRMLMCYLRVCPFTKSIGQDCTVEKREDQCCPIITCPEVPVDVSHHNNQLTTHAPGTELSIPEKYGCSIDSKFYPEGAQVPSNPNKPCELCYCIKNRTSCLMQECTLHIDGCQPIYNKGSCCPVRYSCDHENELLELEDFSTTTTTVRPTTGYILTSTMSPSVTTDCVHNKQVYADGASITGKSACEHCYCMRGDIVCAVQECEMPTLESGAKTCRALPPAEGECCPSNYVCDDDTASTELPLIEEVLTTIAPKTQSDLHDFVSQEDLQLQEHIDDIDKIAATEVPDKAEHSDSELGSGDDTTLGQAVVPTVAPVVSEAPESSEEDKKSEEDEETPLFTTVSAIKETSYETTQASIEPKPTHKTEEDLEDSHIIIGQDKEYDSTQAPIEDEIIIEDKVPEKDSTTLAPVIEDEQKIEEEEEAAPPKVGLDEITTATAESSSEEEEEEDDTTTASPIDVKKSEEPSTVDAQKPSADIDFTTITPIKKTEEGAEDTHKVPATAATSEDELGTATDSSSPTKTHIKPDSFEDEEESSGAAPSEQAPVDQATGEDKIDQDQDIVEHSTESAAVSPVYEMVTEGEDGHVVMPAIGDHKTDDAADDKTPKDEDEISTASPISDADDVKKDDELPVDSTTLQSAVSEDEDILTASTSESSIKPEVPIATGQETESTESEETSTEAEDLEPTTTSRPSIVKVDASTEGAIDGVQKPIEEEIPAFVQEITGTSSAPTTKDEEATYQTTALPAKETSDEEIAESGEETSSSDEEDEQFTESSPSHIHKDIVSSTVIPITEEGESTVSPSKGLVVGSEAEHQTNEAPISDEEDTKAQPEAETVGSTTIAADSEAPSSEGIVKEQPEYDVASSTTSGPSAVESIVPSTEEDEIKPEQESTGSSTASKTEVGTTVVPSIASSGDTVSKDTKPEEDLLDVTTIAPSAGDSEASTSGGALKGEPEQGITDSTTRAPSADETEEIKGQPESTTIAPSVDDSKMPSSSEEEEIKEQPGHGIADSTTIAPSSDEQEMVDYTTVAFEKPADKSDDVKGQPEQDAAGLATTVASVADSEVPSSEGGVKEHLPHEIIDATTVATKTPSSGDEEDSEPHVTEGVIKGHPEQGIIDLTTISPSMVDSEEAIKGEPEHGAVDSTTIASSLAESEGPSSEGDIKGQTEKGIPEPTTIAPPKAKPEEVLVDSTTVTSSVADSEEDIKKEPEQGIADYTTVAPSVTDSEEEIKEEPEQGIADYTTVAPSVAVSGEEIKEEPEHTADSTTIAASDSKTPSGDEGEIKAQPDYTTIAPTLVSKKPIPEVEESGQEDIRSTTLSPSADDQSTEIVDAIEGSGQQMQEIIPAAIPGEGDCLVNDRTFANHETVPSSNECELSCSCISSVVVCQKLQCFEPPKPNNCVLDEASTDRCCPQYICGADSFAEDQQPITVANIEDEEIQFTTVAPTKIYPDVSGHESVKPAGEIAPTITEKEETTTRKPEEEEKQTVKPTQVDIEDKFPEGSGHEPSDADTTTVAAISVLEEQTIKPLPVAAEDIVEDESAITEKPAVDIEMPVITPEKPVSHVKDDVGQEESTEVAFSAEESTEVKQGSDEKIHATDKPSEEMTGDIDEPIRVTAIPDLAAPSKKPFTTEESTTLKAVDDSSKPVVPSEEEEEVVVGGPKIDESIFATESAVESESSTIKPVDFKPDTEAPSLTSVLGSETSDSEESAETPEAHEESSNESGEESDEDTQEQKLTTASPIAFEQSTIKTIHTDLAGEISPAEGTTIEHEGDYQKPEMPEDMSHTKIEEAETKRPLEPESTGESAESEESIEKATETSAPTKAPVSTVLTPVAASEKDHTIPEITDKKDEFPATADSFTDKPLEPLDQSTAAKPISSSVTPVASEEESLPGTVAPVSDGQVDNDEITSQTSAPTIDGQPIDEKDDASGQTGAPAVGEQEISVTQTPISGDAFGEDKDELFTQTNAPTIDENPVAGDDSEEEKNKMPSQTDVPTIEDAVKERDEVASPTGTPITTGKPIAPVSADESTETSDEVSSETTAPVLEVTSQTSAPTGEEQPITGTAVPISEEDIHSQTTAPIKSSEDEENDEIASHTLAPGYGAEDKLSQTPSSSSRPYPSIEEASTISSAEEVIAETAKPIIENQEPSVQTPIKDEENEIDVATIAAPVKDTDAEIDTTEAPASSTPVKTVEAEHEGFEVTVVPTSSISAGDEDLDATETPAVSTPVKAVEIEDEELDDTAAAATSTPVKAVETGEEELDATEAPAISGPVKAIETEDQDLDATETPASSTPVKVIETEEEDIDATEAPTISKPVKTIETEDQYHGFDATETPASSTPVKTIEAGEEDLDATASPVASTTIKAVEAGDQDLDKTEGPASSTPVKVIDTEDEDLDSTAAPVTSTPVKAVETGEEDLDATEAPAISTPVKAIETEDQDIDATETPASSTPVTAIKTGEEDLDATEAPVTSTPVKGGEIVESDDFTEASATSTPVKAVQTDEEDINTTEADISKETVTSPAPVVPVQKDESFEGTQVPVLSQETSSVPSTIPVSHADEDNEEEDSAQTPAPISDDTSPIKTDRGSEEKPEPEVATEKIFSFTEAPVSEDNKPHIDKTLAQTEIPEELVTEGKLEHPATELPSSHTDKPASTEDESGAQTESTISVSKPVVEPEVITMDEVTLQPAKPDSDDQVSVEEGLPSPAKPHTDEVPIQTESSIDEKEPQVDQKKPSSDESAEETDKPSHSEKPETDGEILAQTEKPISEHKDVEIPLVESATPISAEEPATEQVVDQTDSPIAVPSIPKDEDEITAQTAKPISDEQHIITDTTSKPSEDSSAESESEEEDDKKIASTIAPLDIAQTSSPSVSEAPIVPVKPESATDVPSEESDEEGVQTESPRDEVKIQTVAEFVTDRIDEQTTVRPVVHDTKKDQIPEKPAATSSEEESTTSSEEEDHDTSTDKDTIVPAAEETDEKTPAPEISEDQNLPTESAVQSTSTEKPIVPVDSKYDTDVPKPMVTDEEISEEAETPLATTAHPLYPHIELDHTTSRPALNASDKIDTDTHVPETTALPSSTLAPTAEQSTTAQSATNAPTTHYQPPGYVPPQYPTYPEDEYTDEDETEVFGPGTCRYGGKLFVSAQQIPRDDPCDFCFCFRSDIICLQQSCPPPISGCHEEPISGFCCPRYECPVSMATVLNITTSTTTTSTTLPPHFLHHAYRGAAEKNGCHINGKSYKVGDKIDSASGPCMHCTCGGDGQMKCDPKTCSPEPMLRQMIAVVASRRR